MTIASRSLVLLPWLCLTACVPWTIRPLEDAAAKQRAERLSPAAYVDSLWSAKLLPALRAQAVDAAEARKTPTAKLLAVKGQGVVLRVDSSSRVGVAYVDLPPYDGRADLTLQTGPVMRGVALRDVTGLMPFSAFTNQIEFADVAQELNTRALRTLAGRLDSKTPPGVTIRFLGALEVEPGATPPLRWLAPAELEVVK